MIEDDKLTVKEHVSKVLSKSPRLIRAIFRILHSRTAAELYLFYYRIYVLLLIEIEIYQTRTFDALQSKNRLSRI